MFNSGNAMPFTMPVEPAGTNNNGNGGWGGDGWGMWIWVILIFAIFGGWGNGGWGGNGGAGMQGALTRGDLCAEFSFNDLQNGVRNVNDSVSVGFSNLNSTICHQQYDTAQLINGVNANVMQGFHGVDNAVCTLGYQTQQGFNNANVVALQNQNALQTQLAQCCCENRTGQMQLGNSMERGFCDANYNAATNTTAIIQNSHNDTDRILAKLDAMEMSRKDETIQALREKLSQANLAASQSAQNTYLVDQLSPKCPIPAFLTCNPYTGQSYTNGYGYGYNNGGCGCNSGCGNTCC